MVVCKYFQQGNCRFGQYCRFEHPTYGNRNKNFTDDKNIALLVAEEIIHAERGGQWLFSCFGPFKEKKCIPGMEDVSPDEIRWEMYQAQKNGTVDQVKAQFQQMCEQMKVKRDALKHPTQQLVQLLEELQHSGSENSTFNDSSKSGKGNFAFGQSQLGSNSNQTSNVFAQKSFRATTSNNPFQTSSTFNSTQPSSSIFSKSTTNSATSVFGGKPSFGGTSIFGGSVTTTASSIFGGGNKPATGPFGTVQNTQTFSTLAAQGTSIFGPSTTGQSTFGGATSQSAFGGGSTVHTVFGGTTTGQPTFNSAITNQPPANPFGQTSAFGGPAAQQSSSLFKSQNGQTSVFGGASSSTNVFGTPATQAATTVSVFGATPTVSSISSTGGGIFSQPSTTNTAFGSTPVYDGELAFNATPVASSTSVFGGQATFGSHSTFEGTGFTGNIFGGSVANKNFITGFGALAAQGTNVFSGRNVGSSVFSETVAPNASPFSKQVTASPFGQPVQPATASPFGQHPTTAVLPFGQQPTSTTATPFGAAVTGTSVFAPPASTAPSVFGAVPSFSFASPATNTTSNVLGAATVTPSNQSVFGPNAFGTTQSNSSVFGISTTPATTSSSNNVFMTKSQQNTSSPFGTISSTQASPFGNFAVKSSSGDLASLAIDETAYTEEVNLTDEEKAAYKLTQFVEGQIPLKPPTKALC